MDSKWLVLAVVGMALMFRLATGAFLGFNEPPDRAACGADTEEFELGAWNMAQGNGFVLWDDGDPSAFRAPGYPLMLAGLYRLFGRQYWVNRLVLSVVGALTCLIVYRLALAVRLRPPVALCAMLVAALHPLQAYFCGHFMSEVPAAFLNVLATLLLVKGVGGESRKQKAEIETEDRRPKTEDFGNQAEDGRLKTEDFLTTEQRALRATGCRTGSKELCDWQCTEDTERGGLGTTSNIEHRTSNAQQSDNQEPRTKNQEPDSTSLQSSVFSLQSASLFALAGVVNGLSVLVRPAAIFLLPVFGGLLVLQGWRRPVRAMLLAAVFGLGTLAVVAPWSYRNYKVFDRFCLVSSSGGAVLWGANNELTAQVGGKHWGSWVTSNIFLETKRREVLRLDNEIDRDKREWDLGMAFLKGNPAKIPGLLVGKIWRAVSPFPQSPNRVFVLIAACSQIVMLVLCGIGLLGWGLGKTEDGRRKTEDFGKKAESRKQKAEREVKTEDGRLKTEDSIGDTEIGEVESRNKGHFVKAEGGGWHLPLLAQFLTLVATVLVFYGSERFRVPYEPILAVYAGMGLSGVLAWLKERIRK